MQISGSLREGRRIRLLARLVRGEQVGDMGFFHVAGMDNYAVAKTERVTGLHAQAAILRLVVREVVNPEWICREKTVSPGMPIRRVARIRRIIEDRDAHRLAIYGAIVVHPRGPLAPYLL